ncbi:tegument protein UL14 [Bovine herpesvirus type 1.2 strain K22]|uniref:Tegument protein UL14 n=1 Tax=Bovine herpesvirus 1.2 (strain K22) TaxID=31519 RepID=A0A089PGJ2_BHV1K|nr:tegument protein UL14 [Bovine herpesvirus type 1.2 strain K22]
MATAALAGDPAPGSRTAARRRRLRLEEAHRREAIFKSRVVDLVRAGADRDDPAFIHAFTAAKAARRDLGGQIRAAARVEAVRQHARDIETRVAAQAAVAAVLAENRRFLRGDFMRAFDDAEDALLDQEERMGDAAADCGGDVGVGGAWLDGDDESLLAQWLLQSAPRVGPDVLSDDWPTAPLGGLAAAPAGARVDAVSAAAAAAAGQAGPAAAFRERRPPHSTP